MSGVSPPPYATLCLFVTFGYAAVVTPAMVAFVYGYEQPALSQRFGAAYDEYRRAVPGWWPRRRT